MQHATDWKNVAAEVIPIGVEDCSALYTYDSCCRFEDRTACSLRKLEEQSEVGVEDLSDIQDEHHDDDTL